MDRLTALSRFMGGSGDGTNLEIGTAVECNLKFDVDLERERRDRTRPETFEGDKKPSAFSGVDLEEGKGE